MFWVSKVIAPLALVAGIAVTTTVVMADGDGNQPPLGRGGFGQPGKGGDDKKGDKKGEEKKGQPGDKKGPPATPPKADAVVDAWLAVLLTKITDPHDTVRDSARGAVVSVGPAAIPALQKLADGDDPAKAVAARKLIGAIQGRGPGAMAPGGQPGQPGRPGMGPMGPGGMGGRGFGGFPGGPGGPGGGMGPMGPGGRGGPGGDRKGGPERGGRDESDVEVAPMPRDRSR